MKSKIMMLIGIGALALSVSAPNAMAVSNGRGSAARSPHATTSKSVITKKASVSKKASRNAAVPPHTILPGAKNNAF